MRFLPRYRFVKFLIAVTLGLLMPCGAALAQLSQNLAQRVAVESAMRLADDYFVANYSLGDSGWARSVYAMGNMRAYQTLGIQSYLDEATSWGTANSWLIGPEAGTSSDADSQTCGQTYVDLYNVQPDPVRVASITSKISALTSSTSSVSAWTWVDAIFMAAPAFSKVGVLDGNFAYLSQMDSMYNYTRSSLALYSGSNGLWYRDNTAKSARGPNTPQFWGRGNGWAMAACARELEALPAGDSRRPEFQTMLQSMAASIVSLQGTDGFWRSNLLFPNQYPNPETSCTALFTYGLAYGVNHGLLSGTTYTPVVMKAWNGLASTALQSSGKVGYVQGVGAAPAAATAASDQDFGYGAFLLAGSEVLKLLGGPAPASAVAGPDLTITDTNGTYSEPVVLDGSGSVIRTGTALGYSWWVGSTYLGTGEQLLVNFPLGTTAVALELAMSDGNIYTDSRNITVSSTPQVTATASSFQSPNVPANTLDGSLNDRWSAEGVGQWLQFDLGTEVDMSQVGIAFYQGDSRSTFFSLELSTDGTNWVQVYSGQSSGTSVNLETFTFSSTIADYVRIVGGGNTVSDWNSITEVALQLPASLSDSTDSDSNGLPDSWETTYLGGIGNAPGADPAGTGRTILQSYILGVNPLDPSPPPQLWFETNASTGQPELHFTPVAAFGPGYVARTRTYTIMTSTTLTENSWTPLPGYQSVTGDNIPRVIPIPSDPRRYYKLQVTLQ